MPNERYTRLSKLLPLPWVIAYYVTKTKPEFNGVAIWLVDVEVMLDGSDICVEIGKGDGKII